MNWLKRMNRNKLEEQRGEHKMGITSNKQEIRKKAYETLEYDKMISQLASYALSDEAKEKLQMLEPYLDVRECNLKMEETTAARQLLDQFGTPPLAVMKGMSAVLQVCEMGTMLTAEQLEEVAAFLASCKRMKRYLNRAEQSGISISYYGRSMEELEEVRERIHSSINGHQVVDEASTELRNLRRKIEVVNNKIREKLESILRSKKIWFADSYVSVRNGRFVLPVKKEYKHNVPGTVVDISGSGNTLFMEPSAISKLQEELSLLEISEENEVYRILYELTAYVDDNKRAIELNMEAMIALDIIFAKGKLSVDLKAIPVPVTMEESIRIVEGRHPLLQSERLVPLDFELSKEMRGIVITGPNTGGKTVALKTVGLLSMMARSGLHIPAKEGTRFTMHNMVLCDIGDGQSITENLSTFSSHIKNIIEIVTSITTETLVLLDELGSGTDPTEGMGIAIAILEELRAKGCHFVVTTHYPEVKEYAKRTKGIVNARMAFDRVTLSPLYRLEIGEAGESCALFIARRLGFPEHMLSIAKEAAYGEFVEGKEIQVETQRRNHAVAGIPKVKDGNKTVEKRKRRDSFEIGDSVFVYPKKEIGIIYAKSNEFGELGVQIKGKKQLISHKRVKLHVPASELYPPDYDFSIIFDSVATRKARNKMGKRYAPELEVRIAKDELVYKKE